MMDASPQPNRGSTSGGIELSSSAMLAAPPRAEAPHMVSMQRGSSDQSIGYDEASGPTHRSKKPLTTGQKAKKFWRKYGSQLSNLVVLAAAIYAVYLAEQAKSEVEKASDRAKQVEKDLQASTIASQTALSTLQNNVQQADRTTANISQQLQAAVNRLQAGVDQADRSSANISQQLQSAVNRLQAGVDQADRTTANISVQLQGSANETSRLLKTLNDSLVQADSSIKQVNTELTAQLSMVDAINVDLTKNINNVRPLVSFLNGTNSTSITEGLRRTPVRGMYWDQDNNRLLSYASYDVTPFTCCQVHSTNGGPIFCYITDLSFNTCADIPLNWPGWLWSAPSTNSQGNSVRFTLGGRKMCVQDTSIANRCFCTTIDADVIFWLEWFPLMGIRCYRGGN